MSNLREMAERMNQWMNEKPQFGGGQELWLRTGNVAILQFVSDGSDGYDYIKPYRAHVFPFGSKINPKYCTVRSGEPEIPCALCEQGHTDVKERMSIWFYVHDIFHTQLPEGKTFPQAQFEGRYYFREEVQNFRIWHTSAWRESPWTDIIRFNELYKGLHNFTAQLACTGAGRDTRYKLYPIPNSAMVSEELYARAKAECTPIPQLLMSQLATPVVVNPQASEAAPVQQANTPVQPYVVPGATVPQISYAAPVVGSTAAAPAPAPVTLTGDMPPVIPEEDEKRPLQALF